MANIINAFQRFQCRGTDQQVGDELLAQGAAMRLSRSRSFSDASLASAASPDTIHRGSLAIINYALQNRVGSAVNVGLGFRWRNEFWRAGQWDDSEGAAAFILDDVDAKDIGASDFALQTTTNTDGFVVSAYDKFDWVSINVGTAGADAGATSDAAVQYSNTAGTGWTALATTQMYTDEFTYTNTAVGYPTGELLFVWRPPTNWGKVTVADATMGGVPLGMYALQIRTTDAPAETAALATAIEVGSMPVLADNVQDNQIISEEKCYIWDHRANAIVAYFSTANEGNSVKAEWIHA
jgi:nitrogen fixation-related uncharacterized protein